MPSRGLSRHKGHSMEWNPESTKALWLVACWGFKADESNIHSPVDIVKLVLDPPKAFCQAREQWLISLNMALILELFNTTALSTCHHPSIQFTKGSMSSPCLLLAHLLITSMLLNLLGFLLPLVGSKSMWMLRYPPLPSLQLQGITLASPSKFGLESWR